MGTSGAVGFVKNNSFKVAYNHFDSYPSCLGQDVLNYCRERCVNSLNKDYDSIELIDIDIPPTPEQIKKLKKWTNLSVSEQSTSDWYCLFRNAQGNLSAYVEAGMMPNDFYGESGDGEWKYIVNLDNCTLDIYKYGKHEYEIPLNDLPKDLERCGD